MYKQSCTLSREESRYLTRKAAVHHRNALFHRWQRKVLGIRLSTNFDSYALQKISTRSNLRALTSSFERVKTFACMSKISKRKLGREYFGRWCVFHKFEKRMFDLEYKAEVMGHAVSLKRGLTTLVANARYLTRERRADKFFSRRIFVEWRLKSILAQQLRVKGLVAINHYFANLTRRIFNAWKFMNSKAEIFLLKRAGRLVKSVFEHWVVFVPTVRHEQKRDAMIKKMAAEKFKRNIAAILKQWSLVAKKRARATTNARILRGFKHASQKRTRMSTWVVVWMRTKRAQNTVIRLTSKKTQDRIRELESIKGDVVSKKDAVTARKAEIEQELNSLMTAQAELSLSISDTQSLIDIKGSSLVTIKNEAERSTENLYLASKEARALKVIENQRQRENNASQRKFNLKQLKTRREVEALTHEKENLMARVKSSEEAAKKVIFNAEEEVAKGDEKVQRLLAQTSDANKRILRLQEEEMREVGANITITDRLDELRLEERRAKDEIILQQERLSGTVITSKQSEVNALRCRVAESERRAEEAVLLLREKEEEIAELQAAISKHQEGLEMKRLLQDSVEARMGLGLSLEDIGIGVQNAKEAKEAEKEEAKKRRNRMIKVPRMEAVKKAIREGESRWDARNKPCHCVAKRQNTKLSL